MLSDFPMMLVLLDSPLPSALACTRPCSRVRAAASSRAALPATWGSDGPAGSRLVRLRLRMDGAREGALVLATGMLTGATRCSSP